MTNDEIVHKLNSEWPPSVNTVNGRATGFDRQAQSLDMQFEAVPMFCHSGNIVQGGYITSMLDALMAYVVIGLPGVCDMVATLEIKVNFINPGHPGPMNGTGRVIHLGGSIAYLASELHQDDRLVATATSTVKLRRPKPA